ncbi:MAG: trehalase family glycosidase [Deltaproteobacteria bacterium]|nr:trehalase family glycosidase [Deltaproteobacteria bacterium]
MACAHSGPADVASSAPASPFDNKDDAERSLQRLVTRGWNTWNNPSLLSHVLMPEGLALNLVFRNTRGGPYWLRESYVRRVPVPADRELIRPGLRAYDGKYTELSLEWVGVKADVQSATIGDDIVILYSPHKDSSGDRILILETAMLWNRRGSLLQTGGAIDAVTANRKLRIGATSPSLGLNFPLSSPHLTFRSNQEVAFFTGPNRSLAEVKALIASKRKEVEAQSARFGDLAEAHQAMRNVTAWNLFYEAQGDRAVASVSRTWNEAWGGYILFDWDTYFAGWMMAVDDKNLAYANAMAVTRLMTEDGFVPNVAAAFDSKSRDRSQPPVGAMMVKALFDKFHDQWFAAALFDDLLRWNRWWDKHRNNQGYLSWGSDPNTRGMDDPNSRKAAILESGLDNSPLFDDAAFNESTHMLQLASVDLMSLYIADCQSLQALAKILGRQGEAAELAERGKRFTAKLAELWDEETGIYRDKDLVTGKFSKHLGPTNFYPLLARVPTQAQAERMVKEHLFNPKEFYGPWMLPSISRDDPGFGDNEYWRGRIWAPMNFLVYLGLRNYDLREAQHVLAESSVRLLLKEWRANRRVHENYNATTGAGGDVNSSDGFYSWGGLLGLIGLIEGGHF